MRRLLYTQPYGVKPAIFVLILWALLFSPGWVGPRVDPGSSWPTPKALTGLRLSQKWEKLSPTERQRALRNFQRFQQLSPKQKKTLEQRYNRWRSLPSEERKRIRKNYERYQQLDPYEKEDFEERYRKWKARPRGK